MFFEKSNLAKIKLISRVGQLTSSELESMFPGEYMIYLCDFPLTDIVENGQRVLGGYQLGRIFNFDHHFPVPDFYRFVSSGNLAAEHVRKNGTAGVEDVVVITHSDADSIISACITAGVVPPDPILEETVIAADHTGEAHWIADPLQALDVKADLQLSFDTFEALINKVPLPQRAQAALEIHLNDRERAIKVLSQVNFSDSVASLSLGQKLDSGFFPALLPQAAIIVLFVDHGSIHGRRQTKIRLGKDAAVGSTLYDLKIGNFDPNFGGRWNAGSNERNGGTLISEDAYLSFICEAAKKAWY